MVTLKYDVVQVGEQRMMLVLHTQQRPDLREWSTYLDAFVAQGNEVGWDERLVGALAITDGGGPTSGQRVELVERISRPHPHIRAAVVTTNAFVRGIVRAISLMRGDIKAYAPERLSDALQHLGLAAAAESVVWERVVALGAELGIETVRLIAAAKAPQQQKLSL